MLTLSPSEFLSANELAAAGLADQGRMFNPQQQLQVTWPAETVVARAYLDQIQRSDAISASDAEKLTALLARVDQLGAGATDGKLAGQLKELGKELNNDGDDAITIARKEDLTNTLNQIADGIR